MDEWSKFVKKVNRDKYFDKEVVQVRIQSWKSVLNTLCEHLNSVTFDILHLQELYWYACNGSGTS